MKFPMLYTHFYCPGCETDFHVKYAIEQDVADVDFCPSCGQTGRVEKRGTTELDGLIVSKGEIVED